MCPHAKPCFTQPAVNLFWKNHPLSLGMGARSSSQFCSCILKVGNRNWEEKGCVSELWPLRGWSAGSLAAVFPPSVKSGGQSHLVHNKCFPYLIPLHSGVSQTRRTSPLWELSSNPASLQGLTDPQNWPTLGALRPRRRSGPTPGALHWNAVFYHIPEQSAHAILRGSALAP